MESNSFAEMRKYFDTLVALCEYMEENVEEIPDLYFNTETRKNAISPVKVFVNKNFDFSKVLTLKRFSPKFVKESLQQGALIKFNLYKYLTYANPLSLNVNFSESRIGEGYADIRYLYDKDNLNNLFIVLGINLSKNIIDLTPSVYIHELFHTQINSKLGNVLNRYNDEVISIFMEFVYILDNQNDTDLFTINRYIRSRDLSRYVGINATHELGKKTLSEEDYLLAFTYAVSILQAFQLLSVYMSSSLKEKKNILRNVQKVISFELTLEDFLEMYDIGLNSIDNISKYEVCLKKRNNH